MLIARPAYQIVKTNIDEKLWQESLSAQKVVRSTDTGVSYNAALGART